MKKKVVAILLATTMVLSMSACGDYASSTTSSASESAVDTAGKEKSPIDLSGTWEFLLLLMTLRISHIQIKNYLMKPLRWGPQLLYI